MNDEQFEGLQMLVLMLVDKQCGSLKAGQRLTKINVSGLFVFEIVPHLIGNMHLYKTIA